MKKPRYSVFSPREARRTIERLDASIRKIIRKAIDSLAANPAEGKPLAYDQAGLHSLQTSDSRIICQLREEELIIIVILVGHRLEIYKKLKDLLSR